MICRNCQTEVDDDLIFCTNCGERLFEPPEETPTVLMKEPVYTAPGVVKPPKSSSGLKWLALIVALIAIPASIFGILLLRSQNRQAALNNARPNTPTPPPSRRSNTNQNSNANAANTNAANTKTVNINSNTNAEKRANKTEIMNKRLEIAPQTHQIVPFEVKNETARITGKVKVLEGEKIDGYVYFKKTYEENFPDEKFKVFSFGSADTFDVRQTLVEEEYVLVFVNKTDKPVVIQGNFSLD